MKNRFYEFLLFLATVIFGTSYISMTLVGNYLGPFTVNTIRYVIGILFLLPFVYKKLKDQGKLFIKVSILLGITLFISPFLQQLVAPYTSVGKMGFICSLYLVFVPIISFILFKMKIKPLTIIAIIIAFGGLVLLCDIEGFSIAYTDLALIIVALAYAFEIIIMDVYSKKLDPDVMVFGSFVFAALANLILMIFLEDVELINIKKATISILHLGLGTTGIAYTLQAIGQKHVDQIIATLIMSLESVISVIAGYLFFNQMLSTKEIIGCILVFIGVLLCELSSIEKKNPKDSI